MSKRTITISKSRDSKHGRLTKYPVHLKPNDGYYPLALLHRESNTDIFSNIINNYISGRISYNVRLYDAENYIRYRKRRGGKIIKLYSGFFSVLGNSGDFTFSSSSLRFKEDTKFRMDGNVDIFCLGVVKVSQLPEIVEKVTSFKRYLYKDIIVDMDNLKILVSEEKLRKTAFTRDNYTPTVRKEIIKRINDVQREYKNVTIEDVSTDYLESFMIRPKTVRTNSMSKVIQLSNEVKDSVFNNLNDLAI